MSELSFQSVPVPDRFVLRVMSSITEWTAEERQNPDDPAVSTSAPPAAGVWPVPVLQALSQDMSRRTPQIITKMLDFLARTPDGFHRSDVIGRNIGEPAESVSAALRKLHGYNESRFGRTDRPFVQSGNAYAVTAAQAQVWTEARRSLG